MEYTFIKHIDHGGFGKVEKVKGSDGQFYAKKTFELDPRMMEGGLEENAKKRFIQEAQFQSSLNHKNVVPVIELFIDSDPPFFIMPLAEGSLEEDAKTKAINASNFMQPILDILSGLEELHSLDIYHRDLKPSNVLRYRDERGAVYYAIGDFGLMSLKHKTGITALTSATMKKDSDYYTAPEINQHLRNATAASDIYSVGCIIHDFVGKGSRIPMFQIIDRGSYSEILAICTKLDPKKRFQSAASLRDVLATVDIDISVANTEIGTRIKEYLERNEAILSEEEIDEISNYLEDDLENVIERKSVLLQIDLEHIEIIKKSDGLKRFANIYCEFIKNGSFQFGSCDALASRISKLIEGEGPSTQTDGVMALLYMGTNHNRWYVENMFQRRVDSSADLNFIKRLNMEFEVEGKKICTALNHLTWSIRFSYDSMHPILLNTVNKICKIND